jgi:hypothetical protein
MCERNKYIGTLPSIPLSCTTGHHEVKGSLTKKHKLTYHNLKKNVHAQHGHIFSLSVEHKHHMFNVKEHHCLHYRYGEEAMLVTNVDSTFNMACQQVKLVSSDNHKLTYHVLKKQICERNKRNYISHNAHDIDREGQITHHIL